MTSANDKPSLWEISACLLSSVDHAENFARYRPEHAATVTHFLQEIRRFKNELMDEEGSGPSTPPDIVNGLTASIMAERQPEKSGSLNRFVEGLQHAQEEFIRKIRPITFSPLTA